jgi:co-chaperonin GroES (HSP10)
MGKINVHDTRREFGIDTPSENLAPSEAEKFPQAPEPRPEVRKKSPGEFLRPLGNRIILDVDEFHYDGKIVIPDSSKRAPTTGRVVAVGPDVVNIKVGMRVLYAQLSGSTLVFQGKQDCKVVTEDEILCILEGDLALDYVTL